MSSTNVVLPGALSVEAWRYGPDQVLFEGQGCWWNICSTIEGWIGLMWIQPSFKSTNSLATWNHTMLKCYACVVWGGNLCNSIRGEFWITTQHNIFVILYNILYIRICSLGLLNFVVTVWKPLKSKPNAMMAFVVATCLSMPTFMWIWPCLIWSLKWGRKMGRCLQ